MSIDIWICMSIHRKNTYVLYYQSIPLDHDHNLGPMLGVVWWIKTSKPCKNMQTKKQQIIIIIIIFPSRIRNSIRQTKDCGNCVHAIIKETNRGISYTCTPGSCASLLEPTSLLVTEAWPQHYHVAITRLTIYFYINILYIQIHTYINSPSPVAC